MTTSFGSEEFGHVRLGDARLDRRIVKMADRALEVPAGTLSETFSKADEREAAYRFVENESVAPDDIRSAATVATFRRAQATEFLYVPVDSTTVTLASASSEAEFGPVGNRWSREPGVQVMNAIAVDPAGVTIGPVAQVYWTREPHKKVTRTEAYLRGKKGARQKKDTERPIAEKESVHWGTALEQALEGARASGYEGKLWFQLDAGGDFSHLLASATLLNAWLTVRTKNPRSLFQQTGLLHDEVLGKAPVGTMTVEVPQTNNRAGRTAKLELRYVPVVLKLEPRGETGVFPAPLFAVHAVEVSPLPKSEAPIDWLLLTNKPGSTAADAKAVIAGYSTRWRIEEVHKTWKSVTKVEESALESLHAFAIWAVILFSVAVRIERLKYFSRHHAEEPATVEFSPLEIRTLRAFRKESSSRPVPEMVTIGLAVRWVADMGGYMNPHQGPPGSIVLARGLQRLEQLAAGVRLAADL
jgi:hypothetical protein